MKRVNIYLTAKDKKELETLKWKYHVSYSTIANICVDVLVKHIKQYDKYLYVDKGYKTSIKPRLEFENQNSSILYTNAVKMFINKEIAKWTNDDLNKKLTSKIHNELANTWEENWNGNYFNRLMPKLMKKNKEYYKKVLGVE